MSNLGNCPNQSYVFAEQKQRFKFLFSSRYVFALSRNLHVFNVLKTNTSTKIAPKQILQFTGHGITYLSKHKQSNTRAHTRLLLVLTESYRKERKKTNKTRSILACDCLLKQEMLNDKTTRIAISLQWKQTSTSYSPFVTLTSPNALSYSLNHSHWMSWHAATHLHISLVFHLYFRYLYHSKLEHEWDVESKRERDHIRPQWR